MPINNKFKTFLEKDGPPVAQVGDDLQNILDKAVNDPESQPATTQATPTPVEAPKAAQAPTKAPQTPQATSTVPTKPQTANAIFKKMASLAPDKKKSALQDVVKVIQSNGIKWVKEIMAKRKMLEAFKPGDPMEFQNFKKNSQKTIGDIVSKDKQAAAAWGKADITARNVIADYVVTNALKEFDKQKGQTYWPIAPQAQPKPEAKPEDSSQQGGSSSETLTAQEKPPEEQSMFDKIKGAYKDVKAGYDDPSAVAGDIAKRVLPSQTIKGGGGKITTNTTSQGGAIPDETEDETPEEAPKPKVAPTPKKAATNKAPNKAVAPPATSVPATTSPTATTPDPQKEQKKQQLATSLQQDPAGQKLAPKDLATISQGVVDGKKAQDIVNELRAANAGNYTVTDDIKHIIGKAMGEANPSQPVEDTSKLTESMRNTILKSFYMNEAEENDAMSNSKDPVPGDLVMYYDPKLLPNMLKDPAKTKDKVKYNKIPVEIVLDDANAKNPKEAPTEKPEEAAPLKEIILREHIASLFYEEDPPAENTPAEDTPAEDTPEKPQEPPQDKKQPEAKTETVPSGSVKIKYLSGNEANKIIIVKIKDLELDKSLIIEFVKIGFYQADLNAQKADQVFKNQLATLSYNVKNNTNLDAKVDANEIKAILVSPEFKSLLNGELGDLIETNPEAKKKAIDLISQIKETNQSKQENVKTIRIQKIDLDTPQKIAVANSVSSNKPITKDYAIKAFKGKIKKDYDNVPAELVSKVNYAKAFNWYKAGGMVLGMVAGLANGLQKAATFMKGLSGTHQVRNF